MIFYFDENSSKLKELKDRTISWRPGMDAFFGYFLDSVEKLFAGVNAAPQNGPAGENNISGKIPHTHAQLLAYLGGHKPPENFAEVYKNLIISIKDSRTPSQTLPERFDWRNKDGKNYITPVKQQGFASSCVAFGITAAMEALFHIRNGLPVPEGEEGLNLSEQHLYFYNKEALKGKVHSLSGWNIPDALEFARNSGVLSSEDFCSYNPYNSAFQSPALKLPEKWQEQTYKISGFKIIQNEFLRTAQTWENINKTIKTSLIEKGPVISKIALSSDYIFYRDGVYCPVLPAATKDFPSPVYHCVLIVGYDDHKKAWLCKNCFGPGWGKEGYFWNEYQKAGIEDEVYIIEGLEYK